MIERSLRHGLLAAASLLTGCSSYLREQLYRAPSAPVDIAEWTRTAPQTLSVRTSDGLDLPAYFWPGARGDRDVIIFFHGRGAHQGVGAKYAEFMTGRGDAVLVASYRGFSGNPGTPSEDGLVRDGRAFVAKARELVGPGAHVFLAGHSLGGAVALHVAQEEEVAGVITLSTFERLEDAAPHYIGLFLPDPWDNLVAVRRVRAPVVVVHGGADEQVGVDQARDLFAAAHHPAALILIDRANHKPQMHELGPLTNQAVAAMDRDGLAAFPSALPPGWSVRHK